MDCITWANGWGLLCPSAWQLSHRHARAWPEPLGSIVMAGLVPAIHDLLPLPAVQRQVVDARPKGGHDVAPQPAILPKSATCRVTRRSARRSILSPCGATLTPRQNGVDAGDPWGRHSCSPGPRYMADANAHATAKCSTAQMGLVRRRQTGLNNFRRVSELVRSLIRNQMPALPVAGSSPVPSALCRLK